MDGGSQELHPFVYDDGRISIDRAWQTLTLIFSLLMLLCHVFGE
jgi:hypothetical protein